MLIFCGIIEFLAFFVYCKNGVAIVHLGLIQMCETVNTDQTFKRWPSEIKLLATSTTWLTHLITQFMSLFKYKYHANPWSRMAKLWPMVSVQPWINNHSLYVATHKIVIRRVVSFVKTGDVRLGYHCMSTFRLDILLAVNPHHMHHWVKVLAQTVLVRT